MIKKQSMPSIFLLMLFILLNGNNPVLRLFYLFPSSLVYVFWAGIFYLINRNINEITYRSIFKYLFVLSLYILFSFFKYEEISPGRIVQFTSIIIMTTLLVNYYKHTLLYNIEIALKYLCLYSLIIWSTILILKLFLNFEFFYKIPSFLLFPDNENLAENVHALFYNFRGYQSNVFGIFRNSGFFWEPGALAGTIIMMYLMLFKNKKIRNQFDTLFYLVCLTVITTFSILGLGSILLIFAYKLMSRVTNFKLFSFTTVITTVFVVISFQYIFSDNSILNNKINFQTDKVEMRKSGWESNRLGSAIFISELIENENILFGLGFFSSYTTLKNKMLLNGYKSDHSIGNGFFLLYLQFGALLLLIILVFIYYKIYKFYNKTITSLFIFILLVIQLQGEVWSNYNLIYLFLFLDSIISYEKSNFLTQNK